MVRKKEIAKPRKMKSLKTTRAPKSVIAHDAPSKKLIILSKISFCIFEV